ncbi:hypothetical protein D3C78_960560 [compost metagenome]
MLELQVADRVAMVVVDLLEVVDIEGNGGKWLAVGLPLLQGQLQAAAVVEAGEGVGEGVEIELADLPVELGQTGDQRALEFGRLEVPGAHPADFSGGGLRVHLPRAAGQLP